MDTPVVVCSPLSGEVGTPLWCDSLENKVKPLWRPLWLRQPSWSRTSLTQTYLLAKEGNCGKQILRPRLFTLGDIVPYLYFYLALTCYLFTPAILCYILGRSLRSHERILRPIISAMHYTCYALVLYSAVHHIGLNTLHKRTIFIVLSHLKFVVYLFTPPLGIL